MAAEISAKPNMVLVLTTQTTHTAQDLAQTLVHTPERVQALVPTLAHHTQLVHTLQTSSTRPIHVLTAIVTDPTTWDKLNTAQAHTTPQVPTAELAALLVKV